MTDKNEKIQKEINELYEKRIGLLRELGIAENKKEGWNKQIKELQKNLDGIDNIAQEMMEEIGKVAKSVKVAEPEVKSDDKRVKEAKTAGKENYLVKK